MGSRSIAVVSALCLAAVAVALLPGCACSPLDYKSKGPETTAGGLEKEEPSVVVEDDTVMKYEGEAVLIWKAGNDGGIEGGGGTPPLVHHDSAFYVTEIYTYHAGWGPDAEPPAGTISLRAEDGTVYGPWQAEIYNNAYWLARPEVELPAGTYTLIDSDPSTWAQNSASNGEGMGWAMGIPAQ